MAIEFSYNALTDLEEIKDYIAKRSGERSIANNFVKRLVKSLDILEVFPTKGKVRDSLSPDIRQHNYKSYVVLYSVTETGVLIQAVIEGHRDIEGMFDQ